MSPTALLAAGRRYIPFKKKQSHTPTQLTTLVCNYTNRGISVKTRPEMVAVVVMPQTRPPALETCFDPPLPVAEVVKGDVVTAVGSG